MSERTFYIGRDNQFEPVIYWSDGRVKVLRRESKSDCSGVRYWGETMVLSESTLAGLVWDIVTDYIKVFKWNKSDFPTVAEARTLLEGKE